MQAQQRKQLIGASVVALGLVGVGAWLWSRPEPVPALPPPPVPQTPAADMDTVRAVLRRTPVLGERRASARPLAFFPEGTLLFTGQEYPSLDWAREGESQTGVPMETRLSRNDSMGYAFREDLGDELDIRPAEDFCEGVTESPSRDNLCVDRLRRWMRGDVIIGWDECAVGPCRIARDRHGELSFYESVGLTHAEMVEVGERRLLVATRRPPLEGGSEAFLEVFDATSTEWQPIFNEVVERISREGDIVTGLLTVQTFAEDGLHLVATTTVQNAVTGQVMQPAQTQTRVLPWPTP